MKPSVLISGVIIAVAMLCTGLVMQQSAASAAVGESARNRDLWAEALEVCPAQFPGFARPRSDSTDATLKASALWRKKTELDTLAQRASGKTTARIEKLARAVADAAHAVDLPEGDDRAAAFDAADEAYETAREAH